jgi:hypothetical protein
LIDKHLYLPSPFYKNNYIPLFIHNATTGNRLNPKPEIYLVLLNENNKILDFNLICDGKQICKNVKLLNTETAYSASGKQYRILVVDREFNFGTNRPNSVALNTIEDMLSDYLTVENDDDIKSIATSSTISTGLGLKDVNTFSKAIDFMHNTIFLVEDFASNGSIKRYKSINMGEEFLEEVELLKKTYIILWTHLGDCVNQLKKLYQKYTTRFLSAYKINGIELDQLTGIDLQVAIASEIAINGCLFPKLWPSIIKANEKEDNRLVNKINLIRIKLNVEAGNDTEEKMDESTIEQCVEYFKLDKIYFSVNLRPVLKETKKLELLNNPFERLELIKTTIDLLINELTILSIGKNNDTQLVITSEILIPMMAFILVKSKLNYLKSIVYFVEKFSFSSQTNSYPSLNNSYLGELDYFMTTFKASICFIEES